VVEVKRKKTKKTSLVVCFTNSSLLFTRTMAFSLVLRSLF